MKTIKAGKFQSGDVVTTSDFVLFWNPPAVYCQWTPSVFEIEGEVYNCMEQFMMAEKARLFGDETILQQIMATESSRAQKKLGRQVAGFSQEQWEQERMEIVVRGNLAKFGQNRHMKTELMATGDRIIVEASPTDRIWGIGLRADDARCLNPKAWKGLNLLGEALMTVRERFRQDMEDEQVTAMEG